MKTQPPRSTSAGGNYDPYVALEFFKSTGTPTEVKEGKTIFGERDKNIPLFRSSKMYLLLKGEVGLFAGKKALAAVRPGEIFGELAVISGAPRTASAVAKTPATIIGLDKGDFSAALKKKPAFAVMLMGVMIKRLRDSIVQLKSNPRFSREDAWKEAAVFDAKHLAEIADGMSNDRPVFYREGQTIITEGQTGVRMYVVTEGRIRVAIGGRVVERLGPGGVFGEAALVDGATRLASVVAETDCEVLPITRNAFIELVKLDPEFATGLLASLAERLRFLTARLN